MAEAVQRLATIRDSDERAHGERSRKSEAREDQEGSHPQELQMKSAIVIAALAATIAISVPALSKPKPAGPNARYFANCLSDSAAHSTYDRDDRYIRFACYGTVAKAFYDALGQRAPGKTYEVVQADRRWRYTEIPKEDTFGLDGCWQSIVSASGEEPYGCMLLYPAGAFLDD